MHSMLWAKTILVSLLVTGILAFKAFMAVNTTSQALDNGPGYSISMSMLFADTKASRFRNIQIFWDEQRAALLFGCIWVFL
mmetsp:Transcript_7361/g.13129  ORF Transcript_7361/g.13129 Transcript_7361/m.13129 type:complete len:81 (+) Transcript_7361:195-437(+)